MKKSGQKLYLILVVFIIVTCIAALLVLIDFRRVMENSEYESQVENMEEYAQTDAFVVEKMLQGYVDTLNGVAEFFDGGTLKTEKNMELLRGIASSQEFSRLGLIDLNMRLLNMDGTTEDLSDSQYVQELFETKSWTITEFDGDEETNDRYFIVAVPILDWTGKLIGGLQGVMELEKLQPFIDFDREGLTHYSQVIDSQGNYIVSNENSEELIASGNLFTNLDSSQGELTKVQITRKIQNRQSFITERDYENAAYIIYFQPLQFGNWYIVTSMQKKDITNQVSSFLNDSIYPFMLKIATIIVVLALVVILVLRKTFNRELKREKNLRAQLLSDQDSFLVVDLLSDIVLRGSEDFVSKHTKERRYSKMLKAIGDRGIPEEYRDHILERISGQTLLNKYKIGVKKEKVEYPLTRKNGETIWKECETQVKEENKRPVAYILFRDINSQKQKELQLRENADKDFLTGLYNRRRAIELVDSCFENDSLLQGQVHVFTILDLDNFKKLNDTMGHQMGDRALKETADILRQHFRNYDVKCRLGGDEFFVLAKNMPREVVNKNIQALLGKLNRVYTENDRSVNVTASIGIAIMPDHGTTFEKLYEKADIALYQAKADGKNSFCIFSASE